MIYEWFSQGAAMGIKVFVAVFVFLLCCGAVFGMLGVLASVFRRDGNE